MMWNEIRVSFYPPIQKLFVFHIMEIILEVPRLVNHWEALRVICFLMEMLIQVLFHRGLFITPQVREVRNLLLPQYSLH